jgi:hypothetical protein
MSLTHGKYVKYQIPYELDVFLHRYAQITGVVIQDICFNGITRQVEKLAAHKAARQNEFMPHYKAIHELRSQATPKFSQSGGPSPDETILFNAISTGTVLIPKNAIQSSYELLTKVNPCSRVGVFIHMPKALKPLIAITRGNTTEQNFITIAIFSELERQLLLIKRAVKAQGHTTMTNSNTKAEFIPADEPTSAHKLLIEIRELRARLTSLESQRFTPNDDAQLMAQVLLKLAQAVSHQQIEG